MLPNLAERCVAGDFGEADDDGCDEVIRRLPKGCSPRILASDPPLSAASSEGVPHVAQTLPTSRAQKTRPISGRFGPWWAKAELPWQNLSMFAKLRHFGPSLSGIGRHLANNDQFCLNSAHLRATSHKFGRNWRMLAERSCPRRSLPHSCSQIAPRAAARPAPIWTMCVCQRWSNLESAPSLTLGR